MGLQNLLRVLAFCHKLSLVHIYVCTVYLPIYLYVGIYLSNHYQIELFPYLSTLYMHTHQQAHLPAPIATDRYLSLILLTGRRHLFTLYIHTHQQAHLPAPIATDRYLSLLLLTGRRHLFTLYMHTHLKAHSPAPTVNDRYLSLFLITGEKAPPTLATSPRPLPACTPSASSVCTPSAPAPATACTAPPRPPFPFFGVPPTDSVITATASCAWFKWGGGCRA